MDCIKRSKIKLKDYQRKVVYFLSSKKNRGLLLVHPTGFGKTLSAVAYSQCFLDEFPDQEVIVITPASLEGNFKKNMRDYGVKNEEKYNFFSFQKIQKQYKSLKCKENLIIIDEVHELRNMSLGSSKSGLRAKAALFCTFQAKKILIMTATPFVNSLYDLISLTNLVHGSAVITKKSQIKSLQDFIPLLRDRVYYLKPEFDENFPKIIEHTEKIIMDEEYEKDYCDLIKGQIVNESVFSSPASFYNAHRRAVNKVGSGKAYFSIKMDKAIELIGDEKTLIYSNWLSFGLDPISDALEEAGISSEGYSGKISKKEKDQIVEDFNEDKFQVLIIAPAGKQGLDLTGVRKVIVMDPTWHPSGMRQVKGRAQRYGSHAHLPKKERTIDVYYMILETSKKLQDMGCFSGDSIVYKFVETKQEQENYVNEMLESISIQ